MRNLLRYTTRLAAALVVLAVMIVPVVAIAAIAGNPFPSDLLTRVSGRNVNDATIIKLLSLCFYVCWAWFCVPAVRQLRPARPTPTQRRALVQRPATTPIPVVAAIPTRDVGRARGPRGALARLARFAASSAVVVTSLTAGAANASPVVQAPAVVAVVDSPADPAGPVVSEPSASINAATTVLAHRRDTPYSIAARHFTGDQIDAARDEILELNLGRALPDGTTYKGGGFPTGWSVVVPAAATATTTPAEASPSHPMEVVGQIVTDDEAYTAGGEFSAEEPAEALPSDQAAGHVVDDDESYWSISESQLRIELAREPTPGEVLDRVEVSIAYNAPRLGYDDPRMLHAGDVIYVDGSTLHAVTSVTPAEALPSDPAAASGLVVSDGASYWSISELRLRLELAREPTPVEVLDRVEVAIAYNAPRLGYDDPRMLHTGDVIYVDAATLSLGAQLATGTAPADPTVTATPETAPATTADTPIVTDTTADDVVLPAPLPTPTAAAPTPAPRPTPTSAVGADQVPVPPPLTATPVGPAVTMPAPVTVAASGQQLTAVEEDDMLSSRWLFGEIAITSLGLVGAWQTVKVLRRRRSRWLGRPSTPELVNAPSDREREAQLDVAMLRQFVDPARLASNGACAVVLGDVPEIRFRMPPPSPPTGWVIAGGGWRRHGSEPMTAAPVLSPALVTIGHGVDDSISDVVLDLLSAGTVSVTGDRVAVERLMCSMLWELACAPLGDNVELHIVGLACEAACHATNAGRLVSLDEAIATAKAPQPESPQVFLVDPFADETGAGSLRELVEACTPGSGRAVVVAGPCGNPVEEISVPSEHRAMWDDLTLVPPQLPESVDVELGRMLDSIEVGRRPLSTKSASLVLAPDPEAEALALQSMLTVAVDDAMSDAFLGGDSGGDDPGEGEDSDPDADTRVRTTPLSDPPNEEPVYADDVDVPEVILSVCGREVGVRGYPVPQAAAVLFVLAAAGRAVAASELAERTGYAVKSLSTVFTANHELIERDSGMLRLADHVWTDHAWATKCVTQLADAMQLDESAATTRWMLAALEALQEMEQAPFGVLPATRDRGRSGATPWGWIDDFPADAPARAVAETEVAEAALALSELWLAAPVTHRVVRVEQMVVELCRLAATVPYANVLRQLRPSTWVSGAESLLSAAARVATDDAMLLDRVQQTARALAARGQLEASNELADELGL